MKARKINLLEILNNKWKRLSSEKCDYFARSLRSISLHFRDKVPCDDLFVLAFALSVEQANEIHITKEHRFKAWRWR